MKSEWTYRPLGELVSFASGGTPSKKRDDYWGGTIPWISAKTLKTENIDTSDLFITIIARLVIFNHPISFLEKDITKSSSLHITKKAEFPREENLLLHIVIFNYQCFL